MHQKKKMKKRIIAITMILALCLALFACGSKQSGREVLEEQIYNDVRSYLEVLIMTSDDLVKVGTIEVTYIGEDTNTTLEIKPSENASEKEKKIAAEVVSTAYNVNGTCSVLDKYGKEYTGKFDGKYNLYNYKGEYSVQQISLNVN